MAPVLLLFDDHAEARQLRREKLEGAGFSVLTATDELSALAILENAGVAVVILEYKSEGMDAETVAYHIKQRFPSQAIILLSGYFNMPERVLWLVDEVLMRSDSLQQLVEVVTRITHWSPELAPISENLADQRRAAG